MATRQDDTLGNCGCTDYHYSDCPMHNAYAYSADEFDIGEYYDNEMNQSEPEPIAYEECNHGNGTYVSEVAGFHCEDCDSDFIGPLFIEWRDESLDFDWHSFFS